MPCGQVRSVGGQVINKKQWQGGFSCLPLCCPLIVDLKETSSRVVIVMGFHSKVSVSRVKGQISIPDYGLNFQALIYDSL